MTARILIMSALLAVSISGPCPAVFARASNTPDVSGLVPGKSGPPAWMQGTWEVVAQSVVDTSSGVQAYGENDPATIGMPLKITPSSIGWMQNRRTRNLVLAGNCLAAFFDGQAAAPNLQRFRKNHAGLLARWKIAPVAVSTQLSFACTGAKSDWGPVEGSADIVALKTGNIIIFWYDNLALQLRKASK